MQLQHYRAQQRCTWSQVRFVLYAVKIFLKTDMIPRLVEQFLDASRENKRAEFTGKLKELHSKHKVKQKIIWRDFIDCRFNVRLMGKNEREIRINPLSCLFGNLIWSDFSAATVSPFVVTDAVSGLTTASVTFITTLLLFSYISVWTWHIIKIWVYVKSPAQFTKSSSVFTCKLIPHSDISLKRHTTAVPAPDKWPTLHINTHLHEQDPGQLYSFCCQARHVSL